MPNPTSSAPVRVSIELPLHRTTAFSTVIDELPRALAAAGIHIALRPDGAATQSGETIGRVTRWSPHDCVRLEWHGAPWQDIDGSEVDLRFEDADEGTRIVVELRGLGAVLGDARQQSGWFVEQVAAPLLTAAAPAALGDWITDRLARRPSGALARETYGAPLYHYPLFRAILDELCLTSDDNLLEVGCGGGVLLRDALRCGCRAAGIDHSADMVRLARVQNADAIADGRLSIDEGRADALPFEADTFTCATMMGVFGFLPDPVAALAEVHRVLCPGGRVVLAASDPALRGTPAAPEPMASRLHFYDDAETERIARDAGFASADVVRIPLLAHARDVGIPEEHLFMYDGPAPFLVARKAP